VDLFLKIATREKIHLKDFARENGFEYQSLRRYFKKLVKEGSVREHHYEEIIMGKPKLYYTIPEETKAVLKELARQIQQELKP